MENKNAEKGKKGENAVAEYLEKQGFKIVERNYYSRYGEIDIIAENGRTMVFTEVKTRAGNAMVKAVFAVGISKQRKIIKTAQYYLMTHDVSRETDYRFDMAEVVMCSEKITEMNYISGAFIV